MVRSCLRLAVVSLARFASDQEILVRSTLIPEIVFDVRDEFPRQTGAVDTSSIFSAPRVRRHSNGLTSRSAGRCGRIAGNRPAQTGARFPRETASNQNRDVISKTDSLAR